MFKLEVPSPSSDLQEQGGLPSNKHVTIVLITDCPTLTVHTGKCYKALSLVRYSTYQAIDNSLNSYTCDLKLNKVDGSNMTALGITLQLRIADFKFSHNFIICDRLLEMELLFGINVQKKNFPCPMPGTEKRIATYKRRVDSLPTPETSNRRQILLL